MFLRTLRLAMESTVTSMLQGCLDQFLGERVSADEIFGNHRRPAPYESLVDGFSTRPRGQILVVRQGSRVPGRQPKVATLPNL
jgi:hypothetical protein